jgi:hypothetical protein
LGQRVLAWEKEEKRRISSKRTVEPSRTPSPTPLNALESSFIHTQWLPTKRAVKPTLAKIKHQPPRLRKLPGPTSTAGLVPPPP